MPNYTLDVRITFRDPELLERLERYIEREYGRHHYGVKSLIVRQALGAFLDQKGVVSTPPATRR